MSVGSWTGMEIGIKPAAEIGGIDWAASRIELCYRWRFGRSPDLINPTRFTELVQLRKLCDRDTRMIARQDKVASKQIAGDALGKEWTVPTLANWPELPDRNVLPVRAIVKARHGCNQNAIAGPQTNYITWQMLRARTSRWIGKPYGILLDEWAYRDVPRGIIAEPLLGNGTTLPIDYKIYVFGGVATHIQVHTDRASDHDWTLFDRSGSKLAVSSIHDPAMPRTLPDMLEAAETLAKGFHFARIDFYEVNGAPLFGEFCFYPGSGLDRFEEDWIDVELGRLWLAAL